MLARRLVILPVFTGLLLAAAQAGDKVDLKLRLKPGDTHHLVEVIEQKIVQTLPGGNEQKLEQDMRFGLAMKAKSVDPNGITELDSTYESVAFRMRHPMMGTLEYDSEKPQKDKDAASVADAFSALLNKTITARVRANGEVVDIGGTEALLKAMEKKLDEIDDPMAKMAFEGMKEQFNADAMKHSMQAFLAMFPDAPVAVGDTWNRKLSFTAGMPLNTNNTYKLREVREQTAVIEVRSEIATNADEEMEMGGMSMTYDLKGTQQGTLEVDVKSGMVTGGKMKQILKGEISVGGAPQGAMKIPMQIDSEIVLKKPDAKKEQPSTEKKADEKSSEKKPTTGSQPKPQKDPAK
jgi:hypothetical protein